jgi:hypothetical protein
MVATATPPSTSPVSEARRSVFIDREAPAFWQGRLHAKIHGTKHRPWLTALLARKPAKVAAIALANKIALMVWAMARGERSKSLSHLREPH